MAGRWKNDLSWNDVTPRADFLNRRKFMAAAAGVEYSVMDSAEKLLKRARESNDGKLADLDFSAVYEQVHATSTSDFSKKRKAPPS